MRHLAGDVELRVCLGAASAELLGDHDAAVQADPHLDRDVVAVLQARVQLADSVEDRQARVYGALRVVLVRARVTEVDGHSVARVDRGEAAEALDCSGAGLAVVVQDLAKILGSNVREPRSWQGIFRGVLSVRLKNTRTGVFRGDSPERFSFVLVFIIPR